MMKNILIAIAGTVLLLVGLTWVLKEWDSLVIVFKGIMGMVLSVVGMFLLFLASGKSSKQ